MVPPTGASDSIVLERRNGASLECYHGALAPHLKNYSMESNDGRAGKNWAEKWKINKPGRQSTDGQMIETSNFMVHPDYLNKYGTLSNGVLTKSIKYAETWLYGTVAVRGTPAQRPSLFLYPGVVAPAPRLVNHGSYLSSHPPAFVGYPSAERNGYAPSPTRKQSEPRFIADVQLHRCGDCGKDVRATSGPFCKKCGERRNGTFKSSGVTKGRSPLKESIRSRDRKMTPDPYDLMRKSRLGLGDTTESSMFGLERSQKNKRNASASPARRSNRELSGSSFETFKPKQPEREIKLWKNEEEDWGGGEGEIVRRKSILECDVNAYELNKSKNKSKEDESLSEEFEEGTSKVKPKLKILRPKLNKTDLRKNVNGKADPDKGHPQKEGLGKTEVRLNGQRFKIFDHSNPSTSTVEGYVSDEEESKSTVQRPPSPKRPPRRPKDKPGQEVGLKYSKSKSKSSPNLSIKSILKKPTGGDDISLLELSLQCEDTPAASFPSEKSHQQQSQRSHKQSQNTLKKKKQVQFRVNISQESLNQAGSTTHQEGTNEKDNCGDGEVGKDDFVESVRQRSRSCENLSFESEPMNECLNGSGSDEERKVLQEEEERDSHTEDDFLTQAPLLKRSYSDRCPSSAVMTIKDDNFVLAKSPPTTSLFNDTMAIRTRTTRQNTKEVFEEEKAKNSEATSIKLSGNLITYAEFSERTDSTTTKKTNAKTIPKKSKLPVSCNTSTKKKCPAPSPPPRQPVKATKSTKPKPTLSLKDNNANKPQEVTITSADRTQVVQSNCETEDGKILVRLSSASDIESPITEGTRTSIKIGANSIAEEPVQQPQRKTSVLINHFHPQDSNKVTISVRNDTTAEELNSSTCTIIETGSNSTVIPVVSTDNKTTLIVGSNTPVVLSPTIEVPSLSFTVQNEEPETKPEKPSQYIFSTVDADKSIEYMDPVEAVRRNLVPHICGKEDKSPSLMKQIQQSRETREQKNLKQISKLFGSNAEAEEIPVVAQPPLFLLSSYKNKKIVNGKQEGDSSTTTSRSNSFRSSLNSSTKNSSSDTSRSNSFRSNGYKSLESDYDVNATLERSKLFIPPDTEDGIVHEKDKLECEYEIGNGFKDEHKDDCENIYETIKEPIYDRIESKTENDESEDDVPPPLPLTLPPSLDEAEKRLTRSIFEGASKYDILNYLVDAKERVQEESYFSGSSASEDTDSRKYSSLEGSQRSSLDGCPPSVSRTPGSRTGESKAEGDTDSGDFSGRISHISQASCSSDDIATSVVPEKESLKLARKSSTEIERNDSGVGSETSQTSRSKWQGSARVREDPRHLCEDCDQAVETQVTEGGVMYAPLVCRKCSKRRSERKEIIQEIVETEEKYGRDLKIILEEFYTPMLVAGLLTPDQLSTIFLNTEELLENSEQLTEKLRDTLEIASEQGDEDLLTVNIGKLFLEAGPMLHAFESYCTRQGGAAVLLANLEKEKELLRIFLRVSQMENAVLRRMNLNSFLMVPVQRVTKYPLLLARLYKVTPPQQEGRELLKEAQHNIELHLEHMNSEAKDVSATKVWRRFSTSTVSGRKSTAELEMINIKLRKMAVDVLDWNHEEVRFVMEGKLLYTQPTDNNWKRGRTIKLTPIFVLLVTLGKPNSKYKMDPPEDELTFPTKTGVREATLLLVKEKCGRYTLIREPLYLDKIIVCCETDADEYFEIQELSTKDSFIFKAEDGERTKEWYRQLQYHAQILGSWRRRRNALANIMINGMMARAYTS